jgi:hypothetical protein
LSGAGEESAASAAAFRRAKSMVKLHDEVFYEEVLGFGLGFANL